MHANQKSILNVLAISSVRQTNSEKPSARRDCIISKYCGIYGTTPPKIIMHEAIMLRNSCKLMSSIFEIWLISVIVIFSI